MTFKGDKDVLQTKQKSWKKSQIFRIQRKGRKNLLIKRNLFYLVYESFQREISFFPSLIIVKKNNDEPEKVFDKKEEKKLMKREK